MPVRARCSLLCAAVLSLALLLGTAGGGSAAPGAGPGADGPGPTRTAIDQIPVPVDYHWSRGRDGAPPVPTFVGQDGVSYPAAPWMVRGKDGVWFVGQDFDASCAYGQYRKAMDQLVRLVRVIRRTGRTVLFTVAPNKSAVYRKQLPDAVPHGRCARRAMTQQNRILDTIRYPGFIPLRRPLAAQVADGHQVYWRYDTHWNSVATAMYTEEIARRLDPRLARLQSFRFHRERIAVDMAQLGLFPVGHESGPGRTSTTDVKVRAARGSQAYDPDVLVSGDLAWTTRPAHRTWRGRTALVGDSFTYRALGNLMPLFRHGHFVWIGNVDVGEIIKTIAESDTVILESVQRFMGAILLNHSEFRRQVKLAMAAYDRGKQTERG